MSLFQKVVVKKYLENLSSDLIEERYKNYSEYFNNYKTDNEINKMVYELYGLTNQEIEIVESKIECN